jgi:phage gp36-like protein
MPYSNLADIKKLIPEETLIQVTDDEGAGIVVEARIDEAIAQADSEIDAYLGTRYDVPFATVPDVVKKISVDLAIYNLYSRRVEEIPATRADRYKNSIKLLEGIRDGKISIGEATEPPGNTDEIKVGTSEADRIFTRDKLSGF